MNAPFQISRKQGETPAEALDRVVAELEAGGHLPKPPTPEEIAQAEAKADEAIRSLVTAFPGTLPRGGLFDRRTR
jgi:hypothetical protein